MSDRLRSEADEDQEQTEPEPLLYAKGRAPAEVCRACKGVGMVETDSGNTTPCTQPGCDAGFLWIDGSCPTILGPGPDRVPVIAARERLGLPLINPGDPLRMMKHATRRRERRKRREPETVDDILRKWRAEQASIHRECPTGPQEAAGATEAKND
ncbi:MAG: hypothetical protein KDA65_18100 [Planctomycetaceae bacterium]|nr:hypothetical protein [Planctomycetaceae bacterium]